MNLFNRHFLSIGRILALLLFVANSGFTVVLYHCTMRGMDCCPQSEGRVSHACRLMSPRQGASTQAIAARDKCDLMTLAGGLKTDPTVIEKESLTRVVKGDPCNTLNIHTAQSTVPFQIQPTFPTASRMALPHSVETYVLNSTFLI